jgi:hypothetical protein
MHAHVPVRKTCYCDSGKLEYSSYAHEISPCDLYLRKDKLISLRKEVSTERNILQMNMKQNQSADGIHQLQVQEHIKHVGRYYIEGCS